jgi:antirestriction protein ArdC
MGKGASCGMRANGIPYQGINVLMLWSEANRRWDGVAFSPNARLRGHAVLTGSGHHY